MLFRFLVVSAVIWVLFTGIGFSQTFTAHSTVTGAATHTQPHFSSTVFELLTYTTRRAP